MSKHDQIFVARRRDRYLWSSTDVPGPQRIELSELMSRLVAGGSSQGSRSILRHLGGDWVGRVVDGGLLVMVDGTEQPVPTSVLAAAHNRLGLMERVKRVGSDLSARRARPQKQPRPPLRHRGDAETLLRRGWVTMPFLSRMEVQEVRDRYGSIHGWSGEGFEPDPGSRDFEYRSRIARSVGAVLGPRIRQHFDRLEPFLCGCYCKWPTEGPTALHWDWSCVDEHRGHRAYQLWVALQDTSDGNGCMSVVSGSHLIDPRLRGTHLSIPLSEEFEAHAEEALGALVDVPLLAGEALVFDMGLVHRSHANLTDEPRLAAVASLRPAEASLRYYRGIGGGLAVEYEVDEYWYNHMVPMDLMTETPDLSPSALVDVTPSKGLESDVQRVVAGGLRSDPLL